MRELLKKFLNFIFPTRCVDCGRDGVFICQKCIRKIPPPERSNDDWILSVWSYKDPHIKRLLWLLKFGGRFGVLEDLEQGLYDHLAEELSEEAIFENNVSPILVPAPLSKKRFRTRGFNQAELIAKALERKSSGTLKVLNAVEKVRDTKTQHSIKNKSERLRNLSGAFRIRDPELVRGKNVVIVDDITTTNATLREVRKVLREAGTKRVLGFTVAH